MKHTWLRFLKTDPESPHGDLGPVQMAATIPYVPTHKGSISAVELAERIVAETPQLHDRILDIGREGDAVRPTKPGW